MPVLHSFAKFVFGALVAAALAGCSVEQNNVSTSPGVGTEIQIRSGMNCFENKCFRYDASRGTINVSGRRDTSPPAGVNLASGSVTPSEFRATFDKGMRAKTIGGSER